MEPIRKKNLRRVRSGTRKLHFGAQDSPVKLYTHRRLWAATLVLHEQCRNADSPALYLPTLLMVRMTADSYCNFALSLLGVPAEIQRDLFGGKVRKARWIWSTLELSVARGDQCLLSLVRLEELRSHIDHAGMHDWNGNGNGETAEARLFYFSPEIDRLVSADSCNKIFADVILYCETVHEELIKRIVPEQAANLGPRALVGSTWSRN